MEGPPGGTRRLGWNTTVCPICRAPQLALAPIPPSPRPGAYHRSRGSCRHACTRDSRPHTLAAPGPPPAWGRFGNSHLAAPPPVRDRGRCARVTGGPANHTLPKSMTDMGVVARLARGHPSLLPRSTPLKRVWRGPPVDREEGGFGSVFYGRSARSWCMDGATYALSSWNVILVHLLGCLCLTCSFSVVSEWPLENLRV